jgi:hypothetical protein
MQSNTIVSMKKIGVLWEERLVILESIDDIILSLKISVFVTNIC